MKNDLKNEKIRLTNTIAQLQKSKSKLEHKISEFQKIVKEKVEEISLTGKLKERRALTQKLEQQVGESGVLNVKNRVEELKKLIFSPYFARVDFRENKPSLFSSFYIGKFGFESANPRYGIVDWRAPVASLYYNYVSPTEKATYEVILTDSTIKYSGEIRLKRTLIIEYDRLLSYYDHDVEKEMKGEGSARLLRGKLEKKTGGVLEDIIETIQLNQNQIIRVNHNKICVVQGVAGSGKTTVAVHRMAYLFYNYKNQITTENTLLLVSSSLILNYISSILPEIGIYKITQSDYKGFLLGILRSNGISVKLKKNDNSNVNDYLEIEFKTSIDFKKVLNNYADFVQDALIDEISLSNSYTKKEIRKQFKQLSNEPVYKKVEALDNELREELSKIKHKIRESVRYDEIKGLKKQLVEISVAQKFIRSILTKNDPIISYLDLLNKQDLITALCPTKISQKVLQTLSQKGAESFDNADLTAIFYLTYKLFGMSKFKKYAHVVVDEAQDLSLMDFFILKTLSKGKGFTILGDLNQTLAQAGTISAWEDLTKIFGKENINFFKLDVSYRSTEELITFASKVLDQFKGVRYLPKAFSRSGPKPKIKGFKSRELLLKAVLTKVQKIRKKKKHSIGIIECDEKKFKETANYFASKLKTSEVSIISSENFDKFTRSSIFLVPKNLVKGLEFDTVFLIDPNENQFKKSLADAKYLFVCLTRAINQLFIFYCGGLTKLIQQ